MFGLPLAFASPWILLALLTLPLIWLLLRLTPPKPQDEVFPPLAILRKLAAKEETPAQSPWWLTLLRLLMAGLVILAMAGPIWNPRDAVLQKEGPVLLIIDDGWASGKIWDQVKQMASTITGEAEKSNRVVSLMLTTDPATASEKPLSSSEVNSKLEAAFNHAIRPDHQGSAAKLNELLAAIQFGEIVFLSDGVSTGDASEGFVTALGNSSIPVTIAEPELGELAILNPIENQPGKMIGTVSRAIDTSTLPLRVIAYDKDGLPIARVSSILSEGQKSVEFSFAQPVELRNQISRVEIDNASTARAVQLLDEGNRRRIVGLISGQSSDISQPLLSPLYYINRALSPFSDLRIADTSNIEEAANDLIAQNVSVIVMADIGTMPNETESKITKFVEEGGLVIRFAGPRLAANPNGPLLPVDLIEGDRFIGGALSWEEPKAIAAFELGSPFFGLPTPKDISVSRQVLAEQNTELSSKTWARLEDGTPLVTADQLGAGWIVLFHVNSDNNWSNLPLSGSFVDMLRLTVNLSRSTNTATSGDTALRLPAMEILDGTGALTPPPAQVKPLVIEAGLWPVPTLETPPGLYGTADGFVALNLIREKEEINPLDTQELSSTLTKAQYQGGASFAFTPWLLGAATLLFLLDCIAVLWFAGMLGKFRFAGATAALVLAAGLIASQSTFAPTAFAQSKTNESVDFSAALTTRFAYVKTGSSQTDNVSAAGLLGLTRFIGSRTALEPGDPIGVDIANDELAFYPFLYWPIDLDAPVPDEETMARVDAYMKQGGSILFDTKDQINSALGSGSSTNGNAKLREILASLDIPPLEPVPSDHVLTKSFFLLDSFPGRYQGGDLWVEQTGRIEELVDRPARSGDGVSTIMITSNDFAGAWAIDNQNRSLFATIPASTGQREYAFRVGVNIVMYTITGNYKADQVHIPALLERLGQ